MVGLQSTPPTKEVACCVVSWLITTTNVLLSDVETRENKAGQQRLQLPADLMAGEGKKLGEPLSWIQRQ
ncbi:hypothetical protein VM1G_11463 [Cytospora mali]|uniref:Uncharacterized protein n=1 Tax=Cytospora mali TaxID=578113 RepID=A0A194VT16_CYTMA|nr:hypothetical protein VM1G_11463 [Valsa mali]